MSEDLTRLHKLANSRKVGKSADPHKTEVVCPAGNLIAQGRKIGSCGVHCRVDGSYVDSITSPHAFNTYCTARYELCPVWQEERRKEIKHLDTERIKH